MNYKTIYDNLIITRRHLNRIKIKGDGMESHHIIPRSLGGNNSKINKVLLTPREHYLAHRLLIKFTQGKDKAKMVYALHKMCVNNPNQERKYITSRIYENLKLQYSLYCTGENHPGYGKHPHTIQTRKNISERMKGENNPSRKNGPWNKGKKNEYKVYISEATRLKKIEVIKKRGMNNDIKSKISNALKGKPKSNEHKEKLSIINKGKKLSEATKIKMSNSRKGKPQTKTATCPHCGKIGSKSAMYRWHMDKCYFVSQ